MPEDEYGLALPASASDRTMPHDEAAERSVLSAMLLSSDVLQECLILLKPDDFYLYSNRTVYTAMADMFDANVPVDPVSLGDHLKSSGMLDRAGGMAYLTWWATPSRWPPGATTWRSSAATPPCGR